MNEIDSLLRVTGEGVSVKLGDSEAQEAQIEEWLHTPQGSIYGLPGWGNPLQKYKHEPMNTFTEVAIENDMVTSLKRDIPDVELTGIRIEAIEKDLFYLTIGLPSGDYSTGLQKG
ncbi:hypothetical protein AB6T85_21650 [Erwinia sp. ACCC 02193]|uniref:Uncharacterized protein n=1 Tax=Erwinia aeris TaxID=3239803 RepID=A0ABV4EDJ4_9GAMM